ncbi:MAG: TlpA family protein disulfide reductase [Actinomycetota bacterium]|nr:TlpA family protein disulfide reductase [Actinomycetota bacterium]
MTVDVDDDGHGQPADSSPPRAPDKRGPLRHAGLVAALAIGALFIALLAYGLIAQAPDSTIDDALSREQPVPAPGFKLDVLARGIVPAALQQTVGDAMTDANVDLRELRGTPVVLNFWASWCIPCREEAPLLQRAWRSHGKRGALFVGLNMQDVRSDAHGFLKAFKQTYPNVRDPDNSTARAWGVSGIPETFFIGRDGRIVGHVIGVVSPEQLEQGIAGALRGTTLSAQVGGAQRPTR